MDSEPFRDWQKVVELNPKGYMEVQNQKEGTVIHGPVESVSVDETDWVVIKLKWAAQMGLPGTSTFGKWISAPNKTSFTFPNLLIPFCFQDTEKGRRVIFGMNILYIDPVEGVDPSKVENLHI